MPPDQHKTINLYNFNSIDGRYEKIIRKVVRNHRDSISKQTDDFCNFRKSSNILYVIFYLIVY